MLDFLIKCFRKPIPVWYSLHEEQETIFKPTKTNPAPTEYFPAATEYYHERATVISPTNSNLNSIQSPKKQVNVHLIILCVIWGNLFVVAAYAGSIIPLLLALAITFVYLITWQVIKFFKRN